jgi:hypothetical protein
MEGCGGYSLSRAEGLVETDFVHITGAQDLAFETATALLHSSIEKPRRNCLAGFNSGTIVVKPSWERDDGG